MKDNLRIIKENPKNSDGSSPLHMPGQEPERIKKRMERLFDKLDEAYPDYTIVSLNKDHTKWGKTVTELYRMLGYESGTQFLETYGYSVQKKPLGRKKSTEAEDVINELKQKYSGGNRCATVTDLIAENPHLKGKVKTLSNRSMDIFGMPFGKYLQDQGILLSGEEKKINKTNPEKKYLDNGVIEELKRRYKDRPKVTTLRALIADNTDLEKRLNCFINTYTISTKAVLRVLR